MNNEQRLELCQEARWQNEDGHYPFHYLDKNGVVHRHLIDEADGSWIGGNSQAMSTELDLQLYQDTVERRDKLTKILRSIDNNVRRTTT